MASGYGIYTGVGMPDQQQGAQGGYVAPAQSFEESAAYGGPVYTGPSGQAGGAQAPAGGGQGQRFGGAPMGPTGSTMNSGFFGLGGVGKSQFYLPSNASSELRSNKLDPFQMSAQLGGGNIRDEDIAALRQAQNNSQDAAYSGIAQYGIDPTQYLDAYRSGGFTDAAKFFQTQSQKGPLAGVNYNLDGGFGLRGQIGDLNFDVMGMNPNWNSAAAINAWSPYIRGSNPSPSLDNMVDIAHAAEKIKAGGGSRAYQYQGGPNYNPDGTINPYMGSSGYGGASSEYRIPGTGVYLG